MSPSNSESNLMNRVGEDKDDVVYMDFHTHRCLFYVIVVMVYFLF